MLSFQWFLNLKFWGDSKNQNGKVNLSFQWIYYFGLILFNIHTLQKHTMGDFFWAHKIYVFIENFTWSILYQIYDRTIKKRKD